MPPSTQRADKRGREIAAGALGERVAAHRTACGFTVSELAREIGVSPSLISQIERGQSQSSVSTLFALAEALDVPVDAFFDRGQDGEPQRATSEPRSRGAVVISGPSRTGIPREPQIRRTSDGRASIDIEGGVRWERLTPDALAEVDFMELVYAPGARSHGELYRHPGSEMVLASAGS